MSLDNRRMAPLFAPAYYAAMAGESFRQRALAAMEAQGMTKAELSRRSGVPYHALDKFLKRPGASTAYENAVEVAKVLGIKVDGEAEYEELRQLFFRLDASERQFALAALRNLAKTE
jgi:lambda repressor-like predicted transcriptional regulator